jgi:hypothetical protein
MCAVCGVRGEDEQFVGLFMDFSSSPLPPSCSHLSRKRMAENISSFTTHDGGFKAEEGGGSGG